MRIDQVEITRDGVFVWIEIANGKITRIEQDRIEVKLNVDYQSWDLSELLGNYEVVKIVIKDKTVYVYVSAIRLLETGRTKDEILAKLESFFGNKHDEMFVEKNCFVWGWKI